MQEVTSKSIDGITDLVVVAPIRDGFIDAFENITYAARLKLVAEALNRIRITAREYERLQPFSDVTERIMNLLDFRVGILDEDLFGLEPAGDSEMGAEGVAILRQKLVPRRYLYLTATFEGGWEPYMRLIWRPLGAFLDLLFCNCEGYVTATEHGCEEYLQWVRDHQMDSAIFYATTGLTTRDERYLSRLERLVREGQSASAITAFTMPHPEPEAGAVRKARPDKTIELGLEALNVLYKLADFYPPEWLSGRELLMPSAGGGATVHARLAEGHRLIRATAEILRGFQPYLAFIPPVLQALYEQPLNWFTTGIAEVARLDAARNAAFPPDPDHDESEVQAGILKAHGSAADPVRHGALLLFTIRDAGDARRFIDELPLRYEGDAGSQLAGIHHNIAFTPRGLLHIGVEREIVDCMPKEFREGMAARSGIIGDQREFHPRNWILPRRYWSHDAPAALPLPPVEMDEVDFIVQIRANGGDSEQAIAEEIERLAQAATPGATLEAVERMHVEIDPETGLFRDYFGYLDGISQPRPPRPHREESPRVLPRDRVKRGEILLGYANDRGDPPSGPYATLEAPGKPSHWRAGKRATAQQKLLRNGSFLVVRKIAQDSTAFAQWVAERAAWLIDPASADGPRLPLSQAQAEDLIRSKILGRDSAGRPLAPGGGSDANDFDYGEDADGLGCPHAAHVRRANPRRIRPPLPANATAEQLKKHVQVEAEFGRPTPRILRRGMLFEDPNGTHGMMFMAYNASIAEQYETIQRWMNGGNSTDIAAAHNDPLTGTTPREGKGHFRFTWRSGGDERVISLSLPTAKTEGKAPERHPFAPLHWGLYLFVPSRSAVQWLCALDTEYRPMRDMLENWVGKAWLERLSALDEQERADEWKRLLEDFVTKDPTERDISPHLWAAIRAYYGGVIDLGGPVGAIGYDWSNPDRESQNVVLVAGTRQAAQVLRNWQDFSSEEQVRRIKDSSGPIYVAQQPDNRYRNPELAGLGLDYHEESHATNAVLYAVDEESAYQAGYEAGKKALDEIKAVGVINDRRAFKVELRRQFIQSAIGHLWQKLYGLPDPAQELMDLGGWSWKRIVTAFSEADPEDQARTKARCPGDFLASSRATFYPRPGPVIEAFGSMHGKAILAAAEKLVERTWDSGGPAGAPLAQQLFANVPRHLLARNIAGTMVGAIPPMEANLRSIILDWLNEKSLWRHQAALRAATGGASAQGYYAAAREALFTPLSQAICKRPAPDLLYRTAVGPVTIDVTEDDRYPMRSDVQCKEGDLVVVSLVSVSQRSLKDGGPGDVSIVFGGQRDAPSQGYRYDANGKVIPAPGDHPVHACPAQKLSMGAMLGIMAALLDSGRIQALPAALIVRISDW